MKCPYRMLHMPYDGGCQCDMECGCLVEIGEKGNYGSKKSVLACGFVAKGKPVNTIKIPNEERK